MKKEKALTNKKYLLQKYAGTGGWTYAEIPEIPPDKHAHFGWVRVRGWIDDYEIKQYHLMPMGNGNLFLPVKLAIRKKIGKQAGDWVHIVLYADNSEFELPEEIAACFEVEDPQLLKNFNALNESNQKAYIEWINGARKMQTKADRIAKMMKKLESGLGPYDE